jgi:spore coat protein H
MEPWKVAQIHEETTLLQAIKIMTKYNFLLILVLSFTQIQGQDIAKLNLKPAIESKISHTFQLYISEADASNIVSTSGRKVKPKKSILLYNGDTLEIKSLKTRGRSSLNFPRKSISVSLLSPLEIEGASYSKFALIGMVMDKNYWRNRWSFMAMNQIDLFPLFNTYSEFLINDNSMGVYLMLQKADDFTRLIDSPVLVRREYNDGFIIEYAKDEEGKKLKKTINRGRSLPNNFSGKDLEIELAKIIDMRRYYRWLAFNYLVMNGDYTDEIFFFYDAANKIYKVIPWDYDDVFSSQPHEGWQQRRKNIKHDLIFSGEAYLDRVIDQDEYLYSQYLNEFESMITQMSPELVRGIFSQVYQELYPYFMNPEILEQSSQDQYGLTSLESLEEDLEIHYEFFLQRLNSTKQAIENERTKTSQL